jgi:hypothetical protein
MMWWMGFEPFFDFAFEAQGLKGLDDVVEGV